MLSLRPHHGLCIQNFTGKGYNEAFTRNMTSIIAQLEQKNEAIQLVSAPDVLCAACPNEQQPCLSIEKVQRYDAAVLRLCGLTPQDTLDWETFAALCRSRIFDAGKFAEVCSDCEWFDLCSATRNEKSQMAMCDQTAVEKR